MFTSSIHPIHPTTTRQALYFAYGSNLSLTQMKTRCPNSEYHSLGVLYGYRWIINSRGYANVVFTKEGGEGRRGDGKGDEKGEESKPKPKDEDINPKVYGILYTLTPQDEARLDANEGVPWAYEKIWSDVEISSSSIASLNSPSPSSSSPQPAQKTTKEALIYIDRHRTSEGTCSKEYVKRMNRGISDAVERGMPMGYVEGVLRRFVPLDGDPMGAEKF